MSAGPNPSGICLCGCGRKTGLAIQTIPKWGHVEGTPQKFCRGHHITTPIEYRLRHKIIISNPNDCWLAVGRKTYPSIYIHSLKRSILIHRLIYELFNGPIAPGKQLDHLCRNKCCVNPTHLEEVSIKENVLRGIGHTALNARKLKCLNGHPFDELNTYRYPAASKYRGWRQCRQCKRDHEARKLLGLPPKPRRGH